MSSQHKSPFHVGPARHGAYTHQLLDLPPIARNRHTTPPSHPSIVHCRLMRVRDTSRSPSDSSLRISATVSVGSSYSVVAVEIWRVLWGEVFSEVVVEGLLQDFKAHGAFSTLWVVSFAHLIPLKTFRGHKFYLPKLPKVSTEPPNPM